MVVPTGNVPPLGMLLGEFVTEQLSLAFTTKVTLLRLQRPGSAVKTRLPGQVTAGFCVSRIVTVKVQLLALPLASVAVLVTVVVPTGEGLPLTTLLLKFEIGRT